MLWFISVGLVSPFGEWGATGTIQGTLSGSWPAITPALGGGTARGRTGGTLAHRPPTLALALGCGGLGGKYGAPSTSLSLNFAICKMRGLNNWAKWLSDLPVHCNWGNMAKIQFPRICFLLLSGLTSVISCTILHSLSPLSLWLPEH